MKYKALRGMEDILPDNISIWQWLEGVAREEFLSYGYREIRTPMLEETALFKRSIGETSDIVTKEMYTFSDRKGRSLTLRPEGTAPIVRSYVEHSLDNTQEEQKLFYIGPMFRSERPQKGRSRQFHQIGVELIGSNSYLADAEVITQMSAMLKKFGLNNFKIKLNSLGCVKDKDAFSKKLKKYLTDNKKLLCKDCKIRIDKNVLRVLDCKSETCQSVARNAPSILDTLCSDCEKHFIKLKEILKAQGVEFTILKNLVRGLDYYTGTVFEVTHPELGTQDAIGAGGRYDNLIKEFGGPQLGAVGYALGIERIIIALKKKSPKKTKSLFVASLGEKAKIEGMLLAGELRNKIKKCSAFSDVKDTSLKSQMRTADKMGVRLVVIIGEDELKRGTVTLRDMATKEQVEIKRDRLIEEIRKRME